MRNGRMFSRLSDGTDCEHKEQETIEQIKVIGAAAAESETLCQEEQEEENNGRE